MAKKWWFVLLLCLLVAAPAWAQAGAEEKGSLTFEVGNAVTFGSLTIKDTKINVDTAAFNPRAGLEYKFAGVPLCLGVDFAYSKNDLDGTYKDGSDQGDGSLNIKRNDFGAYVRLGSRDTPVNFKLGYRYFKYEYKDGILNQFKNGIQVEWDRDAQATGDLTKGLDAELNFVMGTKFQFVLGLGASYFKDAKYTASYLKKTTPDGEYELTTPPEIKMDAYAVRVCPEFSYLATDNLRIFVNYTLQASKWKDDVKGTAADQYPAIDLYSAAMIGIRYTFPM